ncbi:hiran domain protein [Alcanivorax hongdengensis A-11-3]|uniref:Hiran domain protein n=2 Tax=Alcanivorax hongdengensis TaxID=519051 RepID=L0WFF6_9GAMM|nr:hiran domain protein [Alcanivorax hongdengensis A-11-3]
MRAAGVAGLVVKKMEQRLGRIMNRRRVLQLLFSGTVSGVIAPVVVRSRGKEQRFRLMDTRIAGSGYYAFSGVAMLLGPGDALSLRRQPENPHDHLAVEVFWKNHKLGYLPRRGNAVSAALMDQGGRLSAEVLAVLDHAEHWEPLDIRVWLHV